jgi:hypothetical protein
MCCGGSRAWTRLRGLTSGWGSGREDFQDDFPDDFQDDYEESDEGSDSAGGYPLRDRGGTAAPQGRQKPSTGKQGRGQGSTSREQIGIGSPLDGGRREGSVLEEGARKGNALGEGRREGGTNRGGAGEGTPAQRPEAVAEPGREGGRAGENLAAEERDPPPSFSRVDLRQAPSEIAGKFPLFPGVEAAAEVVLKAGGCPVVHAKPDPGLCVLRPPSWFLYLEPL